MAFAKQVFGWRYVCTVGVHENANADHLTTAILWELKAATSQDERLGCVVKSNGVFG